MRASVPRPLLRAAFEATLRPMDWASLAAIGFSIWLFLPIVAVLIVLLRVRVQRFERGRVRFEDIPQHVFAVVAPDAVLLSERGFELVSPVCIRDFGVSSRPFVYGYHMVHRAAQVHAYVRTAPTPSRARPTMVVVETFVGAADAPTMLAACHARHPEDVRMESPRCRIGRPDVPDAGGIVNTVLVRRAASAEPMVDLDDDAALRCSTECWNGWLEAGVARGVWVPDIAPGVFRPTLGTALRLALRLRFDRAFRAVSVRSARESAAEAPAPTPLEVDGYARTEEGLTRPIARAHAAFFFALGAGLFALWAASGDRVFGAALGAVVFVHELGHAIAMRIAGYRDVRIYFVPFVGGATSGAAHGASIHREAFVLLAGPMPGLVAALGLLGTDVLVNGAPTWTSGSPVLLWLVAIALAVNYLNLLPIFPLDGGRLAHRLVAGRLPWLELVLRAGAAVALLALGLSLGDTLSTLLGAWVLWGVRGAHRLGKREIELRRAGAGELVGDARIAAIFRSLIDVRGWMPRFMLARQLELRLAAPDASWAARVGWGVAYAACLSVAVPFAISAAALWWSDRAFPAEPDAWTACGAAVPAADATTSGLSVLVYCRAEESTVTAIASELDARVGLDGYCVPPAWGDVAPIPPDMARARATILDIDARIVAEGEAAWADYEAARARAAAASLEAARTDPTLDADVAALAARRLDEFAEREIARRVGGDCAALRSSPFVVPSVEPRVLRFGTSPSETAEAVPWLCARGCTEVGIARVDWR